MSVILTTMIRSEVRRALLGRSTLYFLVFGILFTAISAGGTFAGITDALKGPGGDAYATVTMIRAWFAMSLFIGMATGFDSAREVSSGIASRVITALGSRSRYFIAKGIGGTLTGLVGAVVSGAASIGFAAILLHANDAELHMTDKSWLILLGCAVVNTVAGLWGTFIGLLSRNPVIAIVIVFVLCLLVEPALQNFLPNVGRYLITNAMASIYIDTQKNLLSVPWASIAIAGWLVVLGAGAFLLTRNKDLR